MFISVIIIIPSGEDEMGFGLELLRKGELVWQRFLGSLTISPSSVGTPLALGIPNAEADSLKVTISGTEHGHLLQVWGKDTPIDLPFEQWGKPAKEFSLPISEQLTTVSYNLEFQPAPLLLIGGFVFLVGLMVLPKLRRRR